MLVLRNYLKILIWRYPESRVVASFYSIINFSLPILNWGALCLYGVDECFFITVQEHPRRSACIRILLLVLLKELANVLEFERLVVLNRTTHQPILILSFLEHQNVCTNGDFAEHLEREEVNEHHRVDIAALEELLKRLTIVGSHPRVGGDKSQVATFAKQLRTPFVEKHANITCTFKRCITFLSVLISFLLHAL